MAKKKTKKAVKKSESKINQEETITSNITPEILKQRQAYPLDIKIGLSLNRIRHWYNKYAGNVYVAFSGGKDSTVLLHLVRSIYPDVPGLYVDTGLEYPEIKDFVKTFDNIEIIKPNMTFKQVLEKHGYPVISKKVSRALSRVMNPNTSERSRNKTLYGDERGSYGKLPEKWKYLLKAPFKMSDRCCEIMKMRPASSYYKKTGRTGIIGIMASDSQSRMKQYISKGCYISDIAIPKCIPIAFWKDNDIWEYIKTKNISYCKIYDTGVNHTGCMFCLFGLQFEGRPNRFDIMRDTHPKIYEYCMEKLELRKVLGYIYAGIEKGKKKKSK